MSQLSPQPNLVKTRAFQLALVFNWACMGVGVWTYLTFNQELPFVLIILLGGLPMLFVILRYTARIKAAKATAASNPKIVE
jgi:hypothetical protein